MHTGTVDIILDKTSCSCFFYYSSPEVLITSGNDKPLFGPPGFFNAVGRISCISICYYHYTSIMFMLTKDGFNDYYPFLPCKILYFPSIFMQDMCIFFFYFIIYVHVCHSTAINHFQSWNWKKKNLWRKSLFFCSLFQYMYAFPGNP